MKFIGLTFRNGPVSAMRVASSTDVQYKDISISGFQANGIFSINTDRVLLEGVESSDNGDAPVEFSFYDSQFLLYQVPCRNIVARHIRSNNDTHGIIINGCTNVDVSDFVIKASRHDAIEIIQDPKTSSGAWPDDVRMSDGTVEDTGYSVRMDNQPASQAITINTAGVPDRPQRVFLSNISISRPGGECLRLNDHETFELSLLHFYCSSPGLRGSIADSTGRLISGLDLNGKEVRLDDVEVKGAAGPSFYLNSTKVAYAKNIRSTDPNQSTQGLSIDSAIYVKTSGVVHVEGYKLSDSRNGVAASAVTDISGSGDHSFRGRVLVIGGKWAGVRSANKSAHFDE